MRVPAMPMPVAGLSLAMPVPVAVPVPDFVSGRGYLRPERSPGAVSPSTRPTPSGRRSGGGLVRLDLYREGRVDRGDRGVHVRRGRRRRPRRRRAACRRRRRPSSRSRRPSPASFTSRGAARRATRAANTPAPKPLSMFTTVTPGAHEFSMPSSAATPPKEAPYPTDVGTATSGTPTSPPTTLGSAPSIPATTIRQSAASSRSRTPRIRCSPATPTSVISSTFGAEHPSSRRSLEPRPAHPTYRRPRRRQSPARPEASPRTAVRPTGSTTASGSSAATAAWASARQPGRQYGVVGVGGVQGAQQFHDL